MVFDIDVVDVAGGGTDFGGGDLFAGDLGHLAGNAGVCDVQVAMGGLDGSWIDAVVVAAGDSDAGVSCVLLGDAGDGRAGRIRLADGVPAGVHLRSNHVYDIECYVGNDEVRGDNQTK